MVCNAVHKDCILSATFTKMVAVASAKWRGKPCAYARAPHAAPPRHHSTTPTAPSQKAPSPRTCRPFSVISLLGGVHVLYENPWTKKAQWQRFRRACTAWQSRHELLRECFEPHFEERQEKYLGAKCLQDFDYNKTVDPHTLALVASLGPPLARPAPHARLRGASQVAQGAEYLESRDYIDANEERWRWHDLDPNATCIILTDGLKIDPNNTGAKPQRDRAPFLALISAMINHLASTVPSLAIKTGASVRSSRLEKLGSEPMCAALPLTLTLTLGL